MGRAKELSAVLVLLLALPIIFSFQVTNNSQSITFALGGEFGSNIANNSQNITTTNHPLAFENRTNSSEFLAAGYYIYLTNPALTSIPATIRTPTIVPTSQSVNLLFNITVNITAGTNNISSVIITIHNNTQQAGPTNYTLTLLSGNLATSGIFNLTYTPSLAQDYVITYIFVNDTLGIWNSSNPNSTFTANPFGGSQELRRGADIEILPLALAAPTDNQTNKTAEPILAPQKKPFPWWLIILLLSLVYLAYRKYFYTSKERKAEEKAEKEALGADEKDIEEEVLKGYEV